MKPTTTEERYLEGCLAATCETGTTSITFLSCIRLFHLCTAFTALEI